MYGIYTNIYHQYTHNVTIYTSTMDPSWDMESVQSDCATGEFFKCPKLSHLRPTVQSVLDSTGLAVGAIHTMGYPLVMTNIAIENGHW